MPLTGTNVLSFAKDVNVSSVLFFAAVNEENASGAMLDKQLSSAILISYINIR